MKEDSKSSPKTMPKCYGTKCKLGKSHPNPRDGNNRGRVYPMSPHINPPLDLVKEKSNTRGEYQVTLEGNEMESETMEVMPL